MKSTRALSVALVMVVAIGGAASAAAPQYGGWQGPNAQGISGYIHEYSVTGLSGADAIFDWINLCNGGCAQWVQTGMHQGGFRGGDSYGAVHMYLETLDICGDYYGLDIGAPPQANYYFQLLYDGNGLTLHHCQNGMPQYGYTYAYRKGSQFNTPFYGATLPNATGLSIANTEIQNSPNLGLAYFGCNGTNCGDQSYGLQLKVGGSWGPWTGSASPFNGNPPWVNTFHKYWSWKTCPSSC